MEDSAADVERKIMQAHCPRLPPAEVPAEGEAGGAAAAGAEADALHLVKDALQNPCLDYIRHIVLTRPGARFTVAGGKSYSDAEEVRADFLAGIISEEQLKRALVDVRAARLRAGRTRSTPLAPAAAAAPAVQAATANHQRSQHAVPCSSACRPPADQPAAPAPSLLRRCPRRP